MKEIKLKQLTLINFKGVRQLEVNFQDQETVIYGENGTGKTTIFDAFLWLMFGKDSTNRSDSNFNIKTLDANGNPILKLEHSVTGVLSVDGNIIKLQRKYRENWVKPRGKSEETLQNHQTDFYVNDVLLGTKKEYDSEVNSICPEEIFKMITNPYAFTSLPAATQKQMLMDMAGIINDSDVAATRVDYVELLKQLNGASLDRFKKELSAKKNAIKDELLVIPSNIETAQRLMPAEENWAEMEKELSEKRQRITEIDDQLADISKAAEAESNRKMSIQKQIGEKQQLIQKREYEIKQAQSKASNDAAMTLQQIEFRISNCKSEYQNLEQQAQRKQAEIDSVNSELNDLRSQFRSISAEQLSYPEGAFICPTCKRPLETEDIEAKQREFQENFNESKSKRLLQNKNKGTEKKAQCEKLTVEYNDIRSQMHASEEQNIKLQEDYESAKLNAPQLPDIAKIISEDSSIISLKNEISELQNQLSMVASTTDNSDLIGGKEMLNQGVQTLIQSLSKRDQIKRAKEEIQRLEEKRISANQALADIEKQEFVAFDFQKAKDAALMERINGMFSLVSFSFIDQQLNGGEKLTCVCTVNGTPYPDVNAAGRMNAGLDIINAICKSKGITAPIFIDNRESVNQLINSVSQIINLSVSKDKRLMVENNGVKVEL